MAEPVAMPQPLFFSIARGATTTFVNAAHVVKIETDAATLKSGTLYLIDGTQIELNANDTDFISRLMAFGAHEQMKVVGQMKKLRGEG